WKGPGADSEEKREPASDLDTALVDSLKALDPKRPIREADITEVYDAPLICHVATLPLMSRQRVLLLETLPASRRRAPLRIINR
ncbi:MAG: hypothetical protein ACM3Z4_15720, partial [Hyphomicrobiales bacterium]